MQLKNVAGAVLPLLFLTACQKDIKPPVISEEVSTGRPGNEKLKGRHSNIHFFLLHNRLIVFTQKDARWF